MKSLKRCFFILCISASFASIAADPADATTQTHNVISVDSPTTLRIRFSGLPVQVRLANVQCKGAESEKSSLEYLKSNLRPGTAIKIELESETSADGIPLVQLFNGSTHINLELIKQGFAISDGRSDKYGAALQAAQVNAMEKKQGLWFQDKSTAVVAPPAPKHEERPIIDSAPPGYDGPVVADLSSKEYHHPDSRFARNIRAGARIEYKTPGEAERAGKLPSPFSFPDRVKAQLAKQAASGAESRDQIIDQSKKALTEALSYMQEARKLSKVNNSQANENWKRAAKLLALHLDRLTPVADSNPNDRDIQKLAEEMSMNMYSCNKYQSL